MMYSQDYFIDFHSHILPEIDDGAKTMEESIHMIEVLQILGYNKLIATPHINSDRYPNTNEKIHHVWQNVCAELQSRKIDIALEYSAEYFLDDHFKELLVDQQLLPFEQNYLLVEMSFMGMQMNMDEIFWEIISKGYTPILAHPERYLYLKKEDYERLRNLGVRFQFNLLAFQGYYGKQVQKRSYQLLADNRNEFVSTDLHSPKQLPLLHKTIHTPILREMLHQQKMGITPIIS